MDEEMECDVVEQSVEDRVLSKTELLKQILENLELNELLKCRLVNYKWQLTAESLRIEGCSSIKSDHLFLSNNSHFLQANVMQTTLKNLKRLFIDIPQHFSKKPPLFSFMHLLSQLHQLVQLQIGVLHLVKKSTLRLKQLKQLSILHTSGQNLTIDCPNLMAFEIDFNLNRFKFVYPESIKWYAATHYNRTVEKFTNLELYWCRNLYFMKKGFLKLLPKLEKLYCRENVRVDLLNDLLSDRLKLRRPNFAIVYAGLRIQDQMDLNALPESLAAYLFPVDENFQVFLDNYANLDSILPYLHEVNYSSLIASKHFNGTIDLDRFFARFVAIEKVELNDVIIDKQQFVKFIRRCDCLRKLKLHNGALGQEFYDALPTYQPHLIEMAISERLPLRLAFLKDLKNLAHFSINQMPSYYEFAFFLLDFYNPDDSYDSCNSRCDCDDLLISRTFGFRTAEKDFKVISRSCRVFEIVKVKEPNQATEKILSGCRHRTLDFIRMLIELTSDECAV